MLISVILATAVTVVTPYRPERVDHVYVLGTGEALPCNMGWVSDCGWHLRQCGYKRTARFDCVIVEEVKDVPKEKK